MNIIEKYNLYRKTGMEMNHKIIDACLERDALTKSGKLFGILEGNTLIFSSDDETSVLFDFALHEYRKNEKNAVEAYKEKIGWQNETEREIIDAYLSSYTSLFRISSIIEKESQLILENLLNKKDVIRLIDISFSKTARAGLLLFTRIIPFGDFNMTSGAAFAFDGCLEEYLLRKYKKISKKIESKDEALKRFVSFFKLNETDGLEVWYKAVK